MKKIKHCPISRGFTLIELMVVVLITVTLVGTGIAAYNTFNDRRLVESTGSQLYSHIRLIQSWALSNWKPSDCDEDAPLEGHQLVFTDSQTYELKTLCGGEAVDLGRQYTLPTEIELDTGDGVTFYVLGRGAAGDDFCLSGSGFHYWISVSDSGEVSEAGFVSDCSGPTPTPSPSPTESPEPSSCDEYCVSLAYTSGTCVRRKNADCRDIGGDYESGGNEFCTEAPNRKCCCWP